MSQAVTSKAPIETVATPSGKTHQPPELNRRVLVVDDEIAIGEGIKALLSPTGDNVLPFRKSSRSSSTANTNVPPTTGREKFEVTVVTNPTDALKAIEKSVADGKPFAMGFFDVLLGADIDGIELVKRALVMDADMYAVFVTAYHDRSVDSINEYLGGDKSDRWDYINKPFSDGEIIQKARSVTTLWNLKKMKEWHEEQLAEAQRRLLQNERATTVAAVGRSVAHEFGNLMTQIVGHAELALLKNEPERMKQALDTILKASETASNVLGRFKKMAQGGGTDPESEKSLVNLVHPIDEAADLMGYQFRKYQITVKKNKFEQVLIEANHHSLVQVLMNLFINATHAMEKNGGEIEISLGKTATGKAEIRVRDHGPGIPEVILPKVTEAMFSTKGSRGSGLGLAICKEIIEIEHGGEFQVTNHSGGGVEIIIVVPTRQEEQSTKEKT
jgi:signal transduction histidine kinase